ncbi:MAG: hypothetical protein ABSG79_07340 [Bryobacteraceae bacterium]|jgi:hypothetical protein
MKTMASAVSVTGRVRVIGDQAPPARTNRSTKTGLVRRSVSGSVEPGCQRPAGDPLPIWLAALAAARCQVNRNGQDHAVCWSCVSGRALYTNAGADAELIEPLGVRLQGGQTLAVYWLPGETDYTMEVYRQD